MDSTPKPRTLASVTGSQLMNVEPPPNHIRLAEALEVVRRSHANPERAIADACAAGKLAAAYRSLEGATPLDCRVWLAVNWRTYFELGTVILDFPSGRFPREIFIRRDSLDQFIAAPASTAPAKSKSAHQQEIVRPILHTLFGDRVPGPAELSNGALVKQVGERLPKGNSISRKTILRAAGRAK